LAKNTSLKKTTRSKSVKSPKLRTKSLKLSAGESLADKITIDNQPEGQSSGADKSKNINPNPDLFEFDSKTLAQLAVGSSVVIATLLCVPDAVALIPGATSIISWALRLIGNWVICLVLWFVGFSAIVQLLRFVSRGVIASSQGLKLSRFDRLIHWLDIQAISLEPNDFFTKLFSLKVPARKLTIFFRLTAKNKILAHLLFPNFLPSFFFSKDTFDALVRAIFIKSQILPPSSLPETLEHEYSVFAYRPEQLATVRNTSLWLARQRLAVTCIIALSLIVFLGRKAAVNFSYNSGLKAYREGRLEKAQEFYDLAVKFDPTFAAAWNALGQCEFHLAETRLTPFDRARKDWTVALFCKPDFVEPRLNLARLAFYQRRFEEAADHIEHATFFDPQNILALLDKAELDVRRGRPVEGLKEARLVVAQAEGPKISYSSSVEFAFLAHCLIAQAKLDMGDIAGAASELKAFSEDPIDYQNGQNITYLYIVKSRLMAAQKNYVAALKFAQAAVGRQPRNEEALAQAAQIEVDLADHKMAENYLAAARALLVPDPWLSIVYGRLMTQEKHSDDAIAAFKDALVVPDRSQDAFALARVKSELAQILAQSSDVAQIEEIKTLIDEAQRRAKELNQSVFNYVELNSPTTP